MTNANELWLEYRSACDELARMQEKAQLLRHRVCSVSPYKTMTRVRYNNQVYYIYKSELWSAVANSSDEPRYWLTLTKLRKNGTFPEKQMHSTYCSSNEVQLIGIFGDEQADLYFEKA